MNVVTIMPLQLFLKTTKLKSDTDPPIFKSLLERGDLDFVEQLWVQMRKSKSVPLFRKLELICLRIANRRQQ